MTMMHWIMIDNDACYKVVAITSAKMLVMSEVYRFGMLKVMNMVIKMVHWESILLMLVIVYRVLVHESVVVVVVLICCCL